MPDLIHIEALELISFIGVPDEERAASQLLAAFITLETLTSFDALGDDIARTVNYYEVCLAMQALAAARPRKLIETLAAEMCEALLSSFKVGAVEVEIRKFILPYTSHVAVRMRRER